MSGNKILNRFSRNLEKLRINRNAGILAAFSGGGDSSALLKLLSEASEVLNWNFRITAVRVAHGIRSEETELKEEKFCSDFTHGLGIKFIPVKIDHGKIDRIKLQFSCGTEQAARMARYEQLYKIADSEGMEYIFLGHNADDQLETVLMRIFSGSGPEGLSGISWRNGKLVRPLLSISREQLRTYLKDNNLSWEEDSTNSMPVYRRNRIRNELIPLVESIFPGWEKSLISLGERSAEVSKALKLYLENIPVEKNNSICQWTSEDWHNLPDYLKSLLIWDSLNYLDKSGIPDRRIPWKAVKNARSAADSGRIWTYREFKLYCGENKIFLERTESGQYARGRIILTGKDVQGCFRTEIAGFSVNACLNKRLLTDSGIDEKTIIPVKTTWPLVIYLDKNKKSHEIKLIKNNNSDGNGQIVYISIK